MEHKTLTFEVKAVEGRTLEGFAAAFGNLDQVGDVIHPGAFKKTLTNRKSPIKFLWQHDPTEPIGRLSEAKEEPGGLFIKAIISDTSRGRDALALLKDGAIGEMSIGYDAIKGGTDYSKSTDGQPVRNLREIKLYEISLVTFPANEQAIVTALKQQDIAPSEGKPYRNVPDDLQDKMESCVQQVMDKGSDKETAIAICYTSVVEGKSMEDAEREFKIGRMLSTANVARIKRALDALEEALSAAGAMPSGDDEMMDEEPKAAPVVQAAEAKDGEQAGPDGSAAKPPTSTKALLLTIEANLSELHTLEV